MKKLLLILFVLGSGNFGEMAKGQLSRDKAPDSNSLISDAAPSRMADDTQKSRMFVTFDSLYLNRRDKLNEYLIRSFPTDFEGIKPKEISFNWSYKDINIVGLGRCKVYTILLSNTLPEIIGRKAYLVYDRKAHEAAILFLDTLAPIKIKKADTAMLIGGIFQNKGIGYFTVYTVKNDRKGHRLQEIFNSSDNKYCNGGIPVYNSNLDCMCYDPFMLHFNNIDINKDGLNDLTFSGSVLTFCKGLETGFGRNDRKPLRRNRIDIVFLTHRNNDGLYWILSDSGVCKKIVYR